MKPTVKRQCVRCGHVAVVPARRRKCHRPRFGRGSYACWGELALVAQWMPPGALRRAIQQMAAEGEEEHVTVQIDNAQDLRISQRIYRARLVLETALDDMERAVARVKAHRQKIARLETALRTPAEVRSQRAHKALATRKARKVPRRGISLKDKVR